RATSCTRKSAKPCSRIRRTPTTRWGRGLRSRRPPRPISRSFMTPGTRPTIQLQAPTAPSFTVDTDRPNGTQMIAMRVPGLNSPDFPALEVLSDVLSSHRFDLYGLVPQGKALDA